MLNRRTFTKLLACLPALSLPKLPAATKPALEFHKAEAYLELLNVPKDARVSVYYFGPGGTNESGTAVLDYSKKELIFNGKMPPDSIVRLPEVALDSSIWVDIDAPGYVTLSFGPRWFKDYKNTTYDANRMYYEFMAPRPVALWPVAP